MATVPTKSGRREFVKSAAVAGAVAVGILAFPAGLTQVIQAAGRGTVRMTRTYTRLKIARLPDLIEGQPIDFNCDGSDDT